MAIGDGSTEFITAVGAGGGAGGVSVGGGGGVAGGVSVGGGGGVAGGVSVGGGGGVSSATSPLIAAAFAWHFEAVSKSPACSSDRAKPVQCPASFGSC